MEAKLVMILVACLLFCTSNRGNAVGYKLSDLVVTQTKMPGEKEGGYPVYMVTVENRCVCTQASVKLGCTGFNSSISVAPAGTITLDGHGSLCTFIGGGPVKHGAAIRFIYAWSKMFSLEPVSSTLVCSVPQRGSMM